MIKPDHRSIAFASPIAKKLIQIQRILAVAGIFAAQMVSAQVTWTGASGTDTNWSTGGNWNNTGNPGNPPGSSDPVIFNSTAAVSATPFSAVGAGSGGIVTPANFNNYVDGSFSGTISSLIYTNFTASPGNYQNTLLADGVTLTSSGLTIGNYSTDFGAANLGFATIAGTKGTLNINNSAATIIVGLVSATSGSHVMTLDLSGLGTFDATVSLFEVGSLNSTSLRPLGTAYLAQTNTLTIGSTAAINEAAGGSPTMAGLSVGVDADSTGVSYLYLGLTNAINANYVQVGASKQSGAMAFNPLLTNAVPALGPVAYFRAADGVSPITRWVTGDGFGQTGGSTAPTGTLDFSGGTINALVDTMVLGHPPHVSGAVASTGILNLGAGSLNVRALFVGYQTNANTSYGVGTININGPTTISAGTINLGNTVSGGSASTSGTLNVKGGSILAGTITGDALGSSFVNLTNATLIVTNTMGASGAPITTFSISNSTLSFGIPASGAGATVSTFNIGGTTNKISVSSIDATILTYPTALPVIQYTSANGTNDGAFNIGTGTLPVGGYTGFISNDVANSAVVLVVTGGPAPPRAITWSGRDAHNGNITTSTWDIGTTFDWLSNSTAVTYNDNGGLGGDVVTFDDTAATGTVTLHATVSPTGIVVTNNTLSYTISDGNNGYALAGDGSLIKRGSQKLTLDNSGGVSLTGGIDIEDGGTLQVGNNDTGGGLGSGAVTDNGALTFSRNNSTLTVANAISGSGPVADNDGTGTLTLSGANSFDGAVSVASGGVLQIGNNSALGSTNGATTISSGAALDVNAHNVGQEAITVSGTGPDSTKGAIYNSGASIYPALARLTLAGDTTIGGTVSTARWDLRSATTADANGASLVCAGGNAYNLTKVGPNQVGLVGVTVDPNLANIDVQGGILSIEAATTGLGNPADNLTVENGAALQFYQITNRANKNIILQDGSSVISQSGNNTVVGPMTLNGNAKFIIQGNGSLTLSNAISGTGSLTDSGTNTLIIAGTDSHSGGTTINDGTFILNAIGANPNNVLTENVTQSGSVVPVVVGGNGTNGGPVDIEDTFHPGAAGHPSTFTLGSGPGNDYPGQDGTLMFGAIGGGALTTIFDLSSSTTAGSGVNDLIAINGDLEGNFSHIKINPLSLLNTNSAYTLVTYTGVKNGNFSSSVQTVTASRYAFTLNYPANAVTLNVSGGPALLKWNNNAGDGVWNTQGSQNWLNTGTSASDAFYNLDTVVLDDSILSATTPTTSINLTVPVLPTAVTNDSSSANYTISGTGKISGGTGLVKSGSSTLTMDTANDFTGDVVINGGTVVINNAAGGNSSLGAISGGSVTITNGATLDLSGDAVANQIGFTNSAGVAKKFFVSGAGVGGNGAIINNATNQQDAFQLITLTGNTTVGGSARWDMRGNSVITPVLDLNGFTLTKEGVNQMSMVGLMTTNSGNIIINSGVLSFETTSTFTNGSVTITVNPGGAMGHYHEYGGLFTAPITLNGGAIKDLAGAPGSTNDSPITLTANSFLDCNTSDGDFMILNGVISESSGSFGLTKTNSNLYLLTATNTYTGDTVIVGGGIMLTNNGSITLSKNIIIGTNTTLSVAGRTDGTFTMTNGQTLQGSGTLAGTLNNVAGSAMSIGSAGAVGKFTVTGNATLSGTTTIKLDKGNATNDVLIVNGAATFAGTLSLNNLSGTLAGGDQFKIVSAGTYSGTFASIIPANPNNDPNLSWDQSSLNVNGILKVTASGPPPQAHITEIGLNGTALSIQATNGSAGGGWTLLQSTNVALPLAQWETNRTGTFDGSGNLSTNILNAATNNQEFYILKQ